MKKINKLETLSQAEIDRIIEMGWEDRTSFLNWRKRVRGRKTKIENVSDRFKSKKQKN